MKKSHTFLVVFFGLYTLFLPQESSAYKMTAQKALALDSTHALFLIEYRFGHENQTFAMPGVAERDILFGASKDTLGYSIVKNGKEVDTKSTVTAAILSGAERKDAMYNTQKGISHSFILAVLLKTEKDAFESDYALKVTNLPFMATLQDGTKEDRSLNETELQRYVTQETELNTGNFKKK
jgi:hypothetical protein